MNTEQKGKQDFNGTIDGAGYKGSMDNMEKPRLSMVWPGFIAGVARVLMWGAKKYARGNWMRGMSFSEVIDAMKRHLAAIERGEDFDPDTKLHHIFHLACEAMFYAFFATGPRAVEYAKFDDRLYKVEERKQEPDPVDLDAPILAPNHPLFQYHNVYRTRRAVQEMVQRDHTARWLTPAKYGHTASLCPVCAYAQEYAREQGFDK